MKTQNPNFVMNVSEYPTKKRNLRLIYCFSKEIYFPIDFIVDVFFWCTSYVYGNFNFFLYQICSLCWSATLSTATSQLNMDKDTKKDSLSVFSHIFEAPVRLILTIQVSLIMLWLQFRCKMQPVLSLLVLTPWATGEKTWPLPGYART